MESLEKFHMKIFCTVIFKRYGIGCFLQKKTGQLCTKLRDNAQKWVEKYKTEYIIKVGGI